jgi:hypothetical protein
MASIWFGPRLSSARPKPPARARGPSPLVGPKMSLATSPSGSATVRVKISVISRSVLRTVRGFAAAARSGGTPCMVISPIQSHAASAVAPHLRPATSPGTSPATIQIIRLITLRPIWICRAGSSVLRITLTASPDPQLILSTAPGASPVQSPAPSPATSPVTSPATSRPVARPATSTGKSPNTSPPSSPSSPPATRQPVMYGWQRLPNWAGSRALLVSTPSPTCVVISPGALNAAWIRWPRAARIWSCISGGCRRSADSGRPWCRGGSLWPPGSTGPA